MEIIKSTSIDCHLNKEGNIFTGSRWNTPIKMIDSRGNERKVVVEDKNILMCVTILKIVQLSVKKTKKLEKKI